jgi:hypothetical protein
MTLKWLIGMVRTRAFDRPYLGRLALGDTVVDSELRQQRDRLRR